MYQLNLNGRDSSVIRRLIDSFNTFRQGILSNTFREVMIRFIVCMYSKQTLVDRSQ